MKNKVLISGYIGFSNFGDDIMLQLLVNRLKSLGCDITALSSSPELTQKTLGIKCLRYKKFFDILSGILNCNVLIQGGGNLIQNETSSLSLFYYLFIIFLAKLFGKKVFLYSQGIGPVKGAFAEFMCRIILKLPDVITVRDTYSHRILTLWKIRSVWLYDAAWSIETPQYAPENAIGIQVRGAKGIHKSLYNSIAKYVDAFYSDFEIRIFSFQNSVDMQECRKLEKALRLQNSSLKVRVIPYSDTKQVIEDFSKLKYLIAMRLHANILGLNYKIKVLPVSYSTKVHSLAQEFSLEYANAFSENNFHVLMTNLKVSPQESSKLDDARKRKFDWSYIDKFIQKVQGVK